MLLRLACSFVSNSSYEKRSLETGCSARPIARPDRSEIAGLASLDFALMSEREFKRERESKGELSVYSIPWESDFRTFLSGNAWKPRSFGYSV